MLYTNGKDSNVLSQNVTGGRRSDNSQFDGMMEDLFSKGVLARSWQKRAVHIVYQFPP